MKKPRLNIAPESEAIEVRGARQNNLKGIDLDLPLGKLNVITGPSGSGKSSLAFDTIYAEGQRRYVETFSPYTRQFLERMDKPKVDSIRGIPPAIAVEQANNIKTTRSTVGTMTEINDYLKVLMPRVVQAFCPSCQRPIRPETAQSIVGEVLRTHDGETLLVTFAVPVPPNADAREFFAFLQQQGYLRVVIDGEVRRTDEAPTAKRLPANVRVIQDRVAITVGNRSRLCEAVETALRFGKGCVAFVSIAGANGAPIDLPFSTGWHCAHCDINITPPSPGLFSFNHPLGACPRCRGFGRTIAIDLDRAIPDRSVSIAKGAIKPFQGENGRECQRDLLRCAAMREVDVHRPFCELPEADQKWVLCGERPGTPGDELWEEGLWYGVKGFFDWLETKTYKMHVRVLLSRYRSYTECPDCRGGRYQPATLNFRWSGQTLPELMQMPIAELLSLLETDARLPPSASGNGAHSRDSRGSGRPNRDQNREAPDVRRFGDQPGETSSGKNDATTELLLDEIRSRLRYLAQVGLDYLSLDRPTKTLSGGEVERVNLTTCLGASLVNTLFVLDEPSVGLHPRDTGRLIAVMKELRDRGNTLLVVEHEEAVIRAADHVIELGPGRGDAGGELVFAGDLSELCRSGSRSGKAATLTSDYLSARKSIPVPNLRRTPRGWLTIRGAREHNLRNIDATFPLGVFACVTGVSGSGKSTLVHEVLYRKLMEAKGDTAEETARACSELIGAEQMNEVVMVDQSPLARTPRSSPAVYLGIFEGIRELFADSPDALSRGLTASSFSFNSGNGRCERCCGNGWEKIEMQFLSDVFVRCPECEGRRYQPHVLEVRLAGKSIHDVLSMTVAEALLFFGGGGGESPTPDLRRGKGARPPSRDVGRSPLEVGRCGRITAPLQVLADVGLGYLTLGQPLNVLSGGESQRLKLVERLASRSEQNALLILDEPTTGLHFDDVAQLLRVFDRLVEQGNSLLVIEHNLEVIKCADYVIDLGPEAGARGGEIVAVGTPEEVATCEESHTGRFLRSALGGATSKVQRPTFNIKGETGLHAAEDAAKYLVSPTANQRPETKDQRSITIRGAREHNLKNISLDVPRDQMVVITGLSGSGKSTLAFDLLFAEGQRRFLDSMSAYARQFVEQLEKPDVDLICGLPPSVAIEQRITRGGGKSTVATVTEVYHFLRLLYAKVGTQFCPRCDLPVEKQSLAAIGKHADSIAKRGRIRVLAPLVKARKGFHAEVAKWAQRQGFAELLVDGRFIPVGEFQKLDRFREHSIDVVVGASGATPGVQELLKRAIEIGRGTARIIDARGKTTVLSTEMSCPGCGESFEELDPRLFSFNSPHGSCRECRGFGELWHVQADPRLEGALETELHEERQHESLDDGESEICHACGGARLNEVARSVRVQGCPIQAVVALPARQALAWLLKLRFAGNHRVVAADILPEIEQRLHFMAQVGLDYLALDRSAKTLSGGESQRIRLAAQLGSNLRGVLYVLDEPTIGLHPRDNEALLNTLEELKRKGNSLVIVEHDEETMRRADTIIDLGPCAGSRGGEVVAQGTIDAIRQVEQSATGRCLREPLQHPTRGRRRGLPDVTHWLEVRNARLHNLKGADVRFPLGRLSVISGISGSGKSTLMRGVLKPLVEAALQSATRKTATGARNSKPETGNSAAASLAVVEAVEGAIKANRGKRGASEPSAGREAARWKSATAVASAARVAESSSTVGAHLEAIYEVDQTPIGKTSRSTPATYVKVFDEIRALFAQVPLARMRGYTASRFSFNTEGGRCETCAGQGMMKIEMNFLPPSYIDCPDCAGKRYNPATLEVLWNERSIGDVMAMTIEEAAQLFGSVPKVSRTLSLLCDTGLGYLTLGQPSPTLSGGEAQRLKLVSELTRGTGRAQLSLFRQRGAKSMLYLLEEPTIGLHMADVCELLKVLHRLVDEGHTVVVIEHHLSLIAEADYVIDVGPEAGEKGGEIVACGTPEEIAKNKRSRTAPFLRQVLATGKEHAAAGRRCRKTPQLSSTPR